jgi:hypothetical protein
MMGTSTGEVRPHRGRVFLYLLFYKPHLRDAVRKLYRRFYSHLAGLRSGSPGHKMDACAPARHRDAARIASVPSPRPGFVRGSVSAVTPTASAGVTANTAARRSPPIRSIGKVAWTARRNGARSIPAIGSSTARRTPKRSSETGAASNCGTKNGGWSLLQTTP